MVNESARADLRATKMMTDMLKDAEKKAGGGPPPEPAPFSAADAEVMATFIARLRQSWEEELQQRGTRNGPNSCSSIPRGCVPSPRELVDDTINGLCSSVTDRDRRSSPSS